MNTIKHDVMRSVWLATAAVLSLVAVPVRAENILYRNGIVHTVSGPTLSNGAVLVENGKITAVVDEVAAGRIRYPSDATIVDLQRQHLYPGMIAVNTVIGLTEIDAVRPTQDSVEVGDYTPEVESWIAVNPDSELLPVGRANGIAYFEAIAKGGVVAGQSGLLAMEGWTYEQMTVRGPAALHVFWPKWDLDTTPKDRSSNPDKWKSLDDQAKDRRSKLRSAADFFEDARAYARAKDAAGKGGTALEKIPAWEAMLPYVRGQLPIMLHADEFRQIRSGVEWATTNGYKFCLVGGRDAWRLADWLGTNKVTVIFEDTFTQPQRSTEPYDVHFTAPEVLRKAGVKVVFSFGSGGFSASNARNLPYSASQAVAFGMPESEALKGVTLYAAEAMELGDRLGSIEPNKDATLFVCDGNILDIRANVKRLWIAGREVSVESRHTKLYDKYRNRPKP